MYIPWKAGDKMNDSDKLDFIVSQLQTMKSDMQEMKSDITVMKSDITVMNSDITVMKSDITAMKSDITAMNSDITAMNSDITVMKSDITAMKSDIQDTKNDVRDVKGRLTNLELSLEIETNENIKRVAEGHLDLARKLDEALKRDSEKEMLAIRVNILENEVRKVKDALATIA